MAPKPTDAPISEDERARIGGWLTFISERDQDLEVYLVHPRGAPLRRLTRRPGGDYNGPASPDGTQLLLMAVDETPAGKRQSLHVLALAGGDSQPPRRQLGPTRSVVRNPVWTPDGQFVIFEGDSDGFRDLYRVRRDGSGLRRLTKNPEGNFEPAVSPRGDALVFVSSRDRAAELYRARLDGSDQQRLTWTARDEWSPRWSADGARLAFASDREGADRLYVLRLDGSALSRVTAAPRDPAVVEESPAFSPQGALLAYAVRHGEGGGELFVYDAATGARRQVAAGLAGELAEPAWSPDSRYLAFTVRRGSDIQIYVARSDGSGATPVTTAPGPNWNPRWISRMPSELNKS